MSIIEQLKNLDEQDEKQQVSRPEERLEASRIPSSQFGAVEAGLAAFAITSRERDQHARENMRLSRELETVSMEATQLRAQHEPLRKERDFWFRQATIMEQSLMRLGSLIRDEMARIREEAEPTSTAPDGRSAGL